MKLFLTAENKLIMISFGPLIFGVLLFIFLTNLAFTKISEMRTSYNEKKVIETKLISKKSLIESVTTDILSQTNVATVALPGANSTLLVSSQVKKYAFDNGIAISSVKTGGQLDERADIKKGDVSFELTGSKQSIYELLGFLEKMLPLSKISKIELSGSVDLLTKVSLESFWADLPTELPAIDEKTAEFSNEDIETIKTLTEFKLPLFFDIPSTPATENQNPFNI